MSDLSHTTLLAAPVNVTSSLNVDVPVTDSAAAAESVTSPAALIAIAFVSEAEPIVPASAIRRLPTVKLFVDGFQVSPVSDSNPCSPVAPSTKVI